jgi:hypothetical protein
MNSIEDRALSEHRGSGIFTKKSNGRYSLFLPVTGTGENGSAPAQLDKTVIGNAQATSVEGRTENPQKTLPFYAHRDNIAILEAVKGEPLEFLRVLPDFTAMKYSGTVNYRLTNTDVGGLEQGEITITPTSKDEYVENCYDLLEDTALITNSIPEVVTLADKGTYEINVSTNPSSATIAVETNAEGYATATADGKKVTITAVAKGSAIVSIKTTATYHQSFTRTILVVVE